MTAWMSLKLGLVGQKVGHKVKVQKNVVNNLEAVFLAESSPNLVRMFVCMKGRMSLKLGHVGSKSRSLGQI